MTDVLQSINQTHPVLLDVATRVGGLALTLLAAWAVLKLLRAAHERVSTRLQGEMQSETGARDAWAAEQRLRVQTVLRVGYDVARGFVWALVVMTALGQVGVSVQPLVAGAGLAGAAFALGSQTVVKDFVAGFFILLEGHFVIGDTISLGTLNGTVEKMTLRVTLLRDVDGAVHIVPNGSITAVTNKTYRWSQSMLTVGVPAAADQARVRDALALAARATADRDPDRATLLADVAVTGPVNVRGSTVDWTLSVKVARGQAALVKSWMVEAVVKHLTEAQIALVS